MGRRSMLWAGCLIFLACVQPTLSAQKARLVARTHTFVYERPLEEMWLSAATLLVEQGYSVLNTGHDRYVLQTDWRDDMAAFGGAASQELARSRYRVVGVPTSPTSCRLEFTLESERAASGVSVRQRRMVRDYEMEWTLIKTVHPKKAAAIRAQVDAGASG